MRQIESLIGNRYGFLVVKEYSYGKSGKHYWLCLCDCKTKKVVRSDSLKDGSVKSCGCYNKNSKIKDEVGKRFGEWLVLEKVETGKSHSWFKCRCSCGNIRVVRGSLLRSGTTLSCGHNRKPPVMKGDKHPNWQGGITKERDKIRRLPGYQLWRKSVFQRDNYTCQKCKKRGTTLHAHHIRSFASNPKLRTDLNNGICLCEHCHLSFHQRYGKLDNNKRQLNSFMKLKI